MYIHIDTCHSIKVGSCWRTCRSSPGFRVSSTLPDARCSEPFPWQNLKLSLTETNAGFAVSDLPGPQLATVGTGCRVSRECIAKLEAAKCQIGRDVLVFCNCIIVLLGAGE